MPICGNQNAKQKAEDEMKSLSGTEFAIVIYQLSSASRLAETVFGNQELNSVAS